MLPISVAAAVLAALLGHLGALVVPGWFGFESTTTSGMIALASGLLFLLAWFFAPGEGLVTKRLGRVLSPE